MGRSQRIPRGLLLPIPDGSVGDPDEEVSELMDTLYLKNKTLIKGRKGKELDPRAFGKAEWSKFLAAGDKSWQARLATGTMRVVDPKEATTIDPSRILPSPTRFVSTNKATTGEDLEAKKQNSRPRPRSVEGGN